MKIKIEEERRDWREEGKMKEILGKVKIKLEEEGGRDGKRKER